QGGSPRVKDPANALTKHNHNTIKNAMPTP
ncbi:MAG: hypothetical protein RLZZ436_2250, partial [Planctomycetota bacterium]